jgi:predicted membrane protein
VSFIVFAGIQLKAANHFVESFTGSFNTSSYNSGTVVLGSGSWDYSQIRGELAANSYGAIGGAARLNKLIVGGSYLVTPSVNTVGTVSFYYRELNSGGGTFKVQKSINGGAFADVGTQAFSGTAYALYTLTIDDANNTIRIKILSDNNAGFLIVDEVTVTSLVTDPILLTDFSTLSGFTYIVGSGPSTSQSYVLSGSNLTGAPGNIAVTAPADYEISTNNTSFSTSLNVGYTSSTLAQTTIFVRLKSGLVVNTYNSEIISNSGGGATVGNVTCNGSVTTPPPPALVVNPTTLSGFTYIVGSGPSTSQTYVLSGSNLTGAPGSITVTAPADYEVSTNNTSFSASLNVGYTSSTLDQTTIYVRLKSGLAVNTYNSEIISNSGGGATVVNVTCNGSVTTPPPPALTVNPTTLSGFTYIVGSGPSTSQIYNLSGSNLTGAPGDITVTAPTDYEVSINNTSFSASLNVSYTSSTLAQTTIYVRLKSGLAVNTYNSETISNSGGGATTVNVTCNGSVTTPPPPALVVNPTVLSGFTYITGSGPSTSQTYNLSGNNLTGAPGSITVTAPADYEISINNTSFSASLNVSYTSSTLASTTIYVRLKLGLVVNTYNSEIISNSGGGATTVNVTCNGGVTAVSSVCLNEGFAAGITAPTNWTFTSIGGTYTTAGNFGAASPSLKFDATADRVETATITSATELSFWIKGQTATGSSLLVEGFNGTTWTQVDNILLTTVTTGTTRVYNSGSTPALIAGYTKFRFTFTKVTGNLAFDDITVTCGSVVQNPQLNISPNSLSGFTYVEGSGPSASQSYNLSGTDLTGAPGNITVTAPADYEISTNNTSFAASLNVSYTSSTLAQTTIYVRLKSGLSAASYNSELIVNSGGGATSVNVSCNGTVTSIPPPATLIVNTTNLTGFSYNLGFGPSASQSYNLSGTDLTGAPGNITITAPSSFEVSLDDVTFLASLNIAYTSSSLASTTVYVRLKAGLLANTYNAENIVLSGGGATSVNISCSGEVLDPTMISLNSGFENTDMKVHVSPNPNNGNFELFIENIGVSNSSLIILNGLGEIVYSNDNLTSKMPISIRINLNPGLYYLQGFTGRSKWIKKIIVY